METLIFITVLAVVVTARLYIGELASDFMASLPAEERARLKSSMRTVAT
jgi:hypothetical protein